jgi:DNA replication protein DnaC
MTNKGTPPFNLDDACNDFVEHYQKYIPKTEESEGLELTPEIKKAIKILVKYFSNVPQEGVKLSKGIFLRGPYGTGKTKIMTAFSTWRGNKHHFRMVNCRDIQKEAAEIGFSALTKYAQKSYHYKQGMYHKDNGFIIYCFDDFGAEKTTKFYGADINVMEELIQDRYIQSEETGMITHATSNLKDGILIEQVYGPRVRDRLRQMFNFIDLNGKSFRK